MIDDHLAQAHRNNIQRYHFSLQTTLTDFERQYVERRLSEEQSKLDMLTAHAQAKRDGQSPISMIKNVCVTDEPWLERDYRGPVQRCVDQVHREAKRLTRALRDEPRLSVYTKKCRPRKPRRNWPRYSDSARAGAGEN